MERFGSKKETINICIDLKSFYASVECVERGLDSMTTRLVVADPSRGRGAICLAVSPALKQLGVKNRCRMYEIPSNIDFITAKPRMRLYMEYSARIYDIYLKYISKDDVHVYSVDECFIDITPYLSLYEKTPREMAQMLLDVVYFETGIRATVGIGTNLFLAKVALDITAKKAPDFIGYLDEELFREKIWHHRPITDVWNIGHGIAARLERMRVFDLYGITLIPEDWLYKEFGVNAELIIDHAKGIEPCTIADIKAYHPRTHSLSNSQILFEDYNFCDAKIILYEMVDGLVLDLVDQQLVTNSLSLFVQYSKDITRPTGATRKLKEYTNSAKKIQAYYGSLYDETTLRFFPIRRISIGFGGLIDEVHETIDFFTDIDALERERSLQRAMIAIRRRYGRNAVLKGISYFEKGTALQRNRMVGGHNAE